MLLQTNTQTHLPPVRKKGAEVRDCGKQFEGARAHESGSPSPACPSPRTRATGLCRHTLAAHRNLSLTNVHLLHGQAQRTGRKVSPPSPAQPSPAQPPPGAGDIPSLTMTRLAASHAHSAASETHPSARTRRGGPRPGTGEPSVSPGRHTMAGAVCQGSRVPTNFPLSLSLHLP